MKQMIILITLAAVAELHAAPQFITFKDGKLGVNFGGYHAAVGVGGGSGLFAEAGTPFGQQASAGLGGGVGANGQPTGGLFAGATAGNGIKAQAGLGGTLNGQNSNGQPTGGLFAGATAGNGINAQAGLGGALNGQNSMSGGGFASAQYGNRIASAGLGGETNENGAVGFKYSETNAQAPSVIVKETTVEKIGHKHNEDDKIADFVPLSSGIHSNTEVKLSSRTNAEVPVIVKDVSSQWGIHKEYSNYRPPITFHSVMSSLFSTPITGFASSRLPWVSEPIFSKRITQVYSEPAPQYVEKHKVYYKHKPHRHFYKTVNYVDAPAQRRVDNEFDGSVNIGAHANTEVHNNADVAGQVDYKKQITVQRNPQFFADIFNIPISTLKAVSSFLGNTAANTNVSVQKSASVSSDADISSKHAPKTSAASSDTQLTIQTPPVGNFFDDIFAIPINTLGAVNKFLENNVPARKQIQVDGEGNAAVRVGPGARRRAAKRVILVQENSDKP